MLFAKKVDTIAHSPLTLLVRGAQYAHTFFRRLFLHEKGVWRYEFLEFSKFIINLFFWFFTVFWGDVEGAGTFCPRTQATFKIPALLIMDPKITLKR